ncbi:Sulfotransferase family protein [Roseivivax lentus]|uniref:Sulfotransferase family protein n=1 Tax=Roseivivax lentus TaxID=633194 RepID=A0A1N7Q5P9_9RHOB|nr:sulfotransferase family 2 domain-containing protein [Roseivivax lentus]SIT18039.1 Sulfotransferase family protein [Roseivivax lentus]
MTCDTESPLVFLHIPKTAGQSVHRALGQALGGALGGEAGLSPVRLHSQAARGAAQLPPGYRLYSGHIDWEALETLGPRARAFTVLRDPLERIASFYLYLRRKAATLDAATLARPEHTGLARAGHWSAEEYFFGGDPGWRRFVEDHYRAPYCTYLVTRRIRGWDAVATLPRPELIARAADAARGLSGVYDVADPAPLIRDLTRWTGQPVTLPRINAAPETGARWPRLAAELSPASAERLMDWVAPDQALMARLGFGRSVAA